MTHYLLQHLFGRARREVLARVTSETAREFREQDRRAVERLRHALEDELEVLRMERDLHRDDKARS